MRLGPILKHLLLNGGELMQVIKNCLGKTICKVDASEKVVEILFRGVKTLIKFLPDGSIEVVDSLTK